MKVTLNYPEHNSSLENQLIENIALFHAQLIKKSVDMLDVDNQSKKKILDEILKKYELN